MKESGKDKKEREEREGGGLLTSFASIPFPAKLPVPPVVVLFLATEVLVNINETCL